jgi:hypothetical protein
MSRTKTNNKDDSREDNAKKYNDMRENSDLIWVKHLPDSFVVELYCTPSMRNTDSITIVVGKLGRPTRFYTKTYSTRGDFHEMMGIALHPERLLNDEFFNEFSQRIS